MRRFIVGLLLLALAATGFAQTTVADYEDAFDDFSSEVANALPFNSTLGLNWSDSFIGKFPHFGVGLMVGATTIPYAAFEPIEQALNLALDSQLEQFGAPIPAIAVEGRLGGFVLPFDMGVKVGFIPEGTKALLPDDIEADYLLAGFDVRYQVTEGKGLLPEIVVGGGYSYMKTTVTMIGAIPISQKLNYGTEWIQIDDADVTFDMAASAIDLKAQASKKLVIITPYLGLGATYGFGTTSAVATGTVTDSTGGTTITAVEAATGLEIDNQEVKVEATGLSGWGLRAYGGTSVNLWVLKLDLTAMYNFTSGSLGASFGGRIQL